MTYKLLFVVIIDYPSQGEHGTNRMVEPFLRPAVSCGKLLAGRTNRRYTIHSTTVSRPHVPTYMHTRACGYLKKIYLTY
nr:MAG TPA: hypothetical protein [Caudoviricetes sp.]